MAFSDRAHQVESIILVAKLMMTIMSDFSCNYHKPNSDYIHAQLSLHLVVFINEKMVKLYIKNLIEV